MFNRVPAEENQAESAHKVPKMTLTMAELADELHISLPTARKLVRKSGFPAFSVGSRILINREGLQRWLGSAADCCHLKFFKTYLPRAGMCAMIIVAP